MLCTSEFAEHPLLCIVEITTDATAMSPPTSAVNSTGAATHGVDTSDTAGAGNGVIAGAAAGGVAIALILCIICIIIVVVAAKKSKSTPEQLHGMYTNPPPPNYGIIIMLQQM